MLAGENYREVLHSVEQHKHTYDIRTDVMQQLHTLHNLHEVLKMEGCTLPPTLRDDKIPEQVG